MDLRRISKTTLFLVLGMLFCGCVAIIPELVPALQGKSGYVWTPFNSQNFRIGDTYYYAPWLREVLAGHWPLGQPTAVGNGVVSIEAVRAVPFALGALPGLFVNDFRWALLADYWLSGVLSFALVYGIAIAFGCSTRRACVAGIAGYFFNGVWAALPPSAEFLLLLGPPPSVSNWTHSIATNLIEAFTRLWNPQEYDLVGDLFRFVNLSLSGPLLIGHFFAAVSVRQKPAPIRIVGLLAISCAMAFSYPSHPIVAYLVLIGFVADGVVRRDRRCIIAFCSVGLATIIVLLGVGYPQLLTQAYEGSMMMTAVYFAQPPGLRQVGAASLLHAFIINKYAISLPLLAVSLRRNPVAVSSVLVCGGVAIVLSSVVLLNPMILWPRFFGRGIDPLWWVLVAIGIVEASNNLAAYVMAHRLSKAAARLILGLAVIFLLIVPLVGFTRLGLRNAQGLAHYIPTEQWQAYRWISQHLPRNAEVAALDWNDIDLLPVFTDVNLVFGHTDLAGTTSGEQMRRYLAVWRYLGLAPAELQRMIVESVPASRRRVDVNKLAETPFLNPSEYEASQIAESLVYWPYLNEVGGVPFVDGATQSVTREFLTATMNRYDELSPTALPDDITCQYLLVSDYDRARVSIPLDAELVFQNARRTLYRIHTGSSH